MLGCVLDCVNSDVSNMYEFGTKLPFVIYDQNKQDRGRVILLIISLLIFNIFLCFKRIRDPE